MLKELESKLIKKYPKILKTCGHNVKQIYTYRRIFTDNGWYDLLEECLNKLQYFCDLCSKNEKNIKVQVIAKTIKEKYGTLRVHYDVEGASEIEKSIIDDIISETEKKSESVCEVTGKDGKPCVKYRWYKILCYEEAKKRGYKICD